MTASNPAKGSPNPPTAPLIQGQTAMPQASATPIDHAAPVTVRQAVHCTSMAEVRAHIDALDSQIIPLLAERCGYMTQAARIKNHPEQIVDEARIAFIIERVRAMARSYAMPEAVAEASYRAIIAASIEFEKTEFARLRQTGVL